MLAFEHFGGTPHEILYDRQAQLQRVPLFRGVPLTRSCGGPYRVMACKQDIADDSCSQQRTIKASP